VLRLIDRFLMYYIHTANPLERTARWVERQDGGIDYVKSVIIDDALGICDALDRDMQALVDSYQCEWKQVVESPERRRAFAHFANSEAADPALRFVREREQKRPADWPDAAPPAASPSGAGREPCWVRIARAVDFPRDGGRTVKYGATQLAVFHFASRGEWYATQAWCPHRKDMVLGRGLLGSQHGEPKVACPLHKKTFSLATGCGLSDPQYAIRTFPVERRGDDVYALLPPEDSFPTAETSARPARAPACARETGDAGCPARS
jgi:nitrite reductase (NADH) large subunit